MGFPAIQRILLFIAVILFAHVNDALADFDKSDQKYFSNKISVNLPKSWKIAKEKMSELPEGHYWGQAYDGLKGMLFILEGSTDVFMDWKDRKGIWHKEPLAKEAIYIWIMPSEYEQSWKRFFIFERPIESELLFSGKKIKVYSDIGEYLLSEQKADEIISNAESTGWYDSPANTGKLSWESWQKDIKRIFEDE